MGSTPAPRRPGNHRPRGATTQHDDGGGKVIVVDAGNHGLLDFDLHNRQDAAGSAGLGLVQAGTGSDLSEEPAFGCEPVALEIESFAPLSSRAPLLRGDDSRAAAKRLFTREDPDARIAGIEWGHSDAFLDEHPDASKDIDTVMNDAADLVTIDHTLRQIVNVKGD